jgi:hypothetical protein
MAAREGNLPELPALDSGCLRRSCIPRWGYNIRNRY